MVRILIFILCCFVSAAAIAAKPSGLPKPETRSELYQLKSPIEQAQEILKNLGFYKGEIDGIRGPALESAVRNYQQTHGLKQTGTVNSDLLVHLENIGRVRALIGRLDEVRAQRKKMARQALLSDPRTRKLLDKPKEEIADPTRDVSFCFKSPSSSCLLQEAVASSRAVFEDDLRDWALGEILAAQVRAGMDVAAMETASRIKDSRLVIAALTNIAKTHAKEGKLEEAMSSLTLIPMMERRLSVLLEVGQVQLATGLKDDLLKTLETVLKDSDSAAALEDRLFLKIQAAQLLANLDKERAFKLLNDISQNAREESTNGARVTLLRQAATAMASIGFPDSALKMLEELPHDETRIPVLMAAVRAFLEMKQFDVARETVKRISAARYRAVILADMAQAYWDGDKESEALEIVAQAQTASKSIKLPFAKNFALSKIAASLIYIAGQSHDTVQADQAYLVLISISDGRLKARGLWDLANASSQHGFSMTKADLNSEVEKAMDAIKSKFSKAWILGDIADQHQASGETIQARKAFEMGLKTVENLKNPWARSRALAKFGAVIYRLD